MYFSFYVQLIFIYSQRQFTYIFFDVHILYIPNTGLIFIQDITHGAIGNIFLNGWTLARGFFPRCAEVPFGNIAEEHPNSFSWNFQDMQEIDWLVGWLVDWLIDWLIDWLTVCFLFCYKTCCWRACFWSDSTILFAYFIVLGFVIHIRFCIISVLICSTGIIFYTIHNIFFC